MSRTSSRSTTTALARGSSGAERFFARRLSGAKAIKAAKIVGFGDLGMEAIYEFEVKDMPVTVAVDAHGTSVHQTGPAQWQAKIGKIPVAMA